MLRVGTFNATADSAPFFACASVAISFNFDSYSRSGGVERRRRNMLVNFFPGLRFHDQRGSHETALLDAGEPVLVVAERCGHHPATLLRSYTKHT